MAHPTALWRVLWRFFVFCLLVGRILADARETFAAWAVEGAAPFRFFRIRQHGPNSANHQFLVCAGIELYGLLTED